LEVFVNFVSIFISLYKEVIFSELFQVPGASIQLRFKSGLGNLNMLVSNDLFKQEKIGLGM
jgi:hypothetical protein